MPRERSHIALHPRDLCVKLAPPGPGDVLALHALAGEVLALVEALPVGRPPELEHSAPSGGRWARWVLEREAAR